MASFLFFLKGKIRALIDWALSNGYYYEWDDKQQRWQKRKE